MALPESARDSTPPQNLPSNVVWVRGSTELLRVCSQLHRECAEMLYGQNTFLLFVTYNYITFRFRWLLPSGLAPSRSYNLLELMPQRYLSLIRRVIIHVDHVDSYTGMIKFNVSGKGLTHGIRKQVQKLVLALQPLEEQHTDLLAGRQPLSRVMIRVSNSNVVLENINSRRDSSKDCSQKSRDASVADRCKEDVEEMLAPFGELASVGNATVIGVVSYEFASQLEQRMMSDEPRERHDCCCEESMAEQTFELAVRRLCEHS